jgi:branched-chain amino acid transport system permease protein
MVDIASLIIQQSINGVVMGCLYVMVALGLTLIYGVMNQINFAHADFVTLGAFASYFLLSGWAGDISLASELHFWLGDYLAISLTLPFSPLFEIEADELRPLIATIGASILSENGSLLVFGPVPYQYDTPYADAIRIGKIFLLNKVF